MAYRVTWTIDIDSADDPVSAAVRAFVYMQRHGTTANVFDVRDSNGHVTRVDLQEALETDPATGAALDALGQETAACYLLEAGDGVSQQQLRTWGPFEDLDQARREGLQMQEDSPRRSIHLVTVAITPRALLVEQLPTADAVDSE
jgi:hypothetical protein